MTENTLKSLELAKGFLGGRVEVKIDRPLGSKHPKHGFVYGVNYGFVPGTLAPDGEELDAYVLGVNQPIETFQGTCVAIIHRHNDDDDKLIVVPDDMTGISDAAIRQATNFQEKFFTSEIIRPPSK